MLQRCKFILQECKLNRWQQNLKFDMILLSTKGGVVYDNLFNSY